jgi:hypothetical protein
MIILALCNQKPHAGAIGVNVLKHVAQSDAAPASRKSFRRPRVDRVRGTGVKGI